MTDIPQKRIPVHTGRVTMTGGRITADGKPLDVERLKAKARKEAGLDG